MKKFNDVDHSNLFCCYSLNLFHFLKANGFYYVVKNKNEETGRNYWLFEKTLELTDAVTYYTNKK